MRRILTGFEALVPLCTPEDTRICWITSILQILVCSVSLYKFKNSELRLALEIMDQNDARCAFFASGCTRSRSTFELRLVTTGVFIDINNPPAFLLRRWRPFVRPCVSEK